jgi:epoxyqueuosine reductase QueG
MDLKADLKEMSMKLGADLFGVASVTALNDAPQGHRPLDILPEASSIAVLAMKMLDAQVDILPVEGEFFGVSSRQDMYRGHNYFVSQELDRVGFALARFLEKKGFRAYHQMASTGGTDQRFLMGLLSLKHIAVQAGLGVLGQNSLLLTRQFGPRVRLTAIVTDADIQPDTTMEENFCESCGNNCISSCPAKALELTEEDIPYRINKYACRQYLTTRPTCSVCLKVCPVGKERIK